jgi:CRP-like cAMP-binding protein
MMLINQEPLALLVRNLQLRSSLSEEDCAAILALPTTVRTLEPGTYLVREAESIRSCAVLMSGFAYRHKLTGEGTRQIVALHLPGDALDLQHLFLDVADHNVQMLTRGEVAYVPVHNLQQLTRSNASVANAILIKIMVEASVFREWVLNVGRRDAITRVAHLLCELGVRLDAEGLAEEYGYELPMTQEQLGDAVGLTPVHVNRTLKTLEKEGLISRTRRAVEFPNWTALRRTGDFNQRYLHLERQRSGETV